MSESAVHDEAREAYRELVASPAAAGARVLVEAMVPPGVELFVAARADGVVPALVIGVGGVWVEAMDDVVVVPLPADAERCRKAVLSLRGAAALRGDRGGTRADIDAVAALAARVGGMLLESALDLIELNPVIAHERGCVAVDAVARRSPAPA